MVPNSQYFWVDADIPFVGKIRGWTDGEEYVEPGQVFIDQGEGLWVNAPNTTFKLQSSGAVDQKGVGIALRAGRKLVCNPTPVAADYYDIKVSGYDPEEGTDQEVDIQKLDYRGKLVPNSQFFWVDADVPFVGKLYGWTDGSDYIEERGVAALEPGEAIWVNSPNTSFQIEFPGVEIK